MELVECPRCKTRVVLMANGECPACRQDRDVPQAVPLDPSQDPDFSPGRAAGKATDAPTLVAIQTFECLPEAEAAKMHLEEQGIPAFLIDAEIVSMAWTMGNAVGYIKLQVPSDRAATALAILREHGGTPPGDDDLEEDAETPAEDEEEPQETIGVLDALRSLKRPVFWLLLSPLVIGLGVAVVAVFDWLVRTVLSR